MNNNNNNNRNNNNRRRGRGGNRQQGGGGQQLNRVDSRARGNAPQLLEKYRKLAHDAHLNGDRVQEEYYLQFADHYFRVLADQRARQEEQRTPRREWQEGSEGFREENDDSGDYGNESDYQSYERQNYGRQDRPDREVREPRPPREERTYEPREEAAAEEAVSDSPAETASEFEPPENPFVREARGPRGLRPRRDNRARSGDDGRSDDAPAGGLDPSLLPPAIAAVRGDEPGFGDVAAEAAPKRRTRRTRPPVDDAGEALEVVG